MRDDDLIAGRAVEDEPELVRFVAALRATADEPAPAPTAALLALLEQGRATTQGRSGTRHRALRVAARVTLGAGIAVASVTGAAALEAVPAVVREPARSVVDSVVRVLLPGSQDPAAWPVPAGSGAAGAGATRAPSEPSPSVLPEQGTTSSSAGSARDGGSGATPGTPAVPGAPGADPGLPSVPGLPAPAVPGARGAVPPTPPGADGPGPVAPADPGGDPPASPGVGEPVVPGTPLAPGDLGRSVPTPTPTPPPGGGEHP